MALRQIITKLSRKEAKRPNGFALVETLIAAAIIAGMLGVVYQVIETGARHSRTVENRRLAVMVAQSRLAAVGAAQNASLGETKGQTNGVRWRVEITPRRSELASDARLENVTVTTGMTGEDRDLFILRTIRVAK